MSLAGLLAAADAADEIPHGGPAQYRRQQFRRDGALEMTADGAHAAQQLIRKQLLFNASISAEGLRARAWQWCG
ncbi:hypothetical protein ACQEV9_45805 [Streptomyces chartreusis]|uniref:hypothetical protein n=1 Tax=Streptomyces chartreusis TaxID=1969 RepID=UPI003D8D8A1F